MATKSKKSVSVKSEKSVAVNPDAPIHTWSNLNGELLYARGEHVVIRDDLEFPPTVVKYGYERKNAVNVYTLEIQDGSGKEYFAFEDSIRSATKAEIATQEKWRDTEGAKQAAKALIARDRANHETAEVEVDLVAMDPSIGRGPAPRARKVPVKVKKGTVKVSQAEKPVTKASAVKSVKKVHTVVKASKNAPKAAKTVKAPKKGKRKAA